MSGDEPGSDREIKLGIGRISSDLAAEITKERYRYVLQQIHTVNENVYRFLSFYQGLVTALLTAQVLLFANHRSWHLSVSATRTGIISFLILETAIAVFTSLLVIIGILSWLDYRNEECDILDSLFGAGFRKRPRIANWYRWYETYILGFIVVSIALMWLLIGGVMVSSVS